MTALTMAATSAWLTARAAPFVLAAAGIAAAFLLARESIDANLARTCTVDDTPYLELCPKAPNKEQHLSQLKSRIAASPGDSKAYVQLAFAEPPASRAGALDAAARLAPSNPTVTAMTAAHALEAEDWPGAIKPLISLVEHGASDKAALVMARIIASGRWQLLAEYVTPGAKWLERVLAQMPSAQGPFSAALPLVALGLDRRVFGPAELMPYVRQLKSAGAWNDAYSLWVALHQGASPRLYNAGFDQPFKDDGFDWEVAAQQPIGRAGALVTRAADEKRGALLDIRFTGRPFAVPLVRQYVFLGPGRYRLRGDYKTAQLRIEQGLAWTVRCTSTSTPQAARSVGLGDTANAWQSFEFVFAVPANCGWVASLQLETFAPSEATLGSRGRASFDALSLEKLER